MTDNQDLQGLLERGIALARTGQKDEARLLFEAVIQADQYNEQAWLWMAAVARTTPERREALEIVLEINPHNPQAREALNRLGGPRARRRADEARAIAQRIGSAEEMAEADFQPVIERPAPEPEAPAPEPEPTPEEKETALARTLIATARAERAAGEPDAEETAGTPPETSAQGPESGPLVEVIDVERVRRQREARLLGLAAAALIVLIALVLALPALETAISGGPTPTDSFLTQIARLNTPTATYSNAVIVTALPLQPGQVPATWTPSPTPTVTQTPTASATPLPPGSYALVFSRRAPEASGYALYTVRGDGTAATRLTAGTGDDRHPAPGPARTRLAFVTEIDGKRQVAFLALGGGAGDSTPLPTATGGTPANTPVDAPAPGAIEALTRITATAISAPAWSPDGYRLVFSAAIAGNEEVYVTDVDGASFVRLTDNDVIDRDPAWSPDGQWIVFASERDGSGQLELYRMRPNGADVTQLTNSQGSSYAPAWAPDSQRIVFVSDRDRDADLYVMNADGTNEQLLSRNDSAEDRDPAWSPDGRWIAFSSNRDSANFRLFLLDPFVGTVLPVTRGSDDDLEAAWLPEQARR